MLCYLFIDLFDLGVCGFGIVLICVLILVLVVFDGCVFLLFVLYCVLCEVVEVLCDVFWFLFV